MALANSRRRAASFSTCSVPQRRRWSLVDVANCSSNPWTQQVQGALQQSLDGEKGTSDQEWHVNDLLPWLQKPGLKPSLKPGFKPKLTFTLSLLAQNLPFQQILSTVDFFYLLDCLTITGLDQLIILFLVLHFNFLFVPCGRLSWLPVSFLLHVKHTLSYRIVS